MGDHHDENHDGVADRATDDQPAVTAGEEDHSDPWAYAGEDVDAPEPGEVPDGVA